MRDAATGERRAGLERWDARLAEARRGDAQRGESLRGDAARGVEPGQVLAEAVARLRVGGPPHMLLALRLSDHPGVAADQTAALRALFAEQARSFGGEWHLMANGDLAMLAPRPRGGTGVVPAALASPVGQILGLGAGDAGRLLACWGLDGPAEGALGYIQARLADARPPDPEAPPAWGVAVRRVAVRLPDSDEPGAIRVLHHVLAAPEERAEDQDLELHRRALFGLRLAGELTGGQAGGSSVGSLVGPGRLAAFGGAPVHLALPLRGAVEMLTGLSRAPVAALGVDISCAEAATDPAGYEALRRLTRQAGMALALQVDADLLRIADPAALAPDLVKLAAGPELMEASAQLVALRAALGAGRLLLSAADNEDRLRWGVSMGIRRFEGGQTDMLLAAARRLVCPHAAGCTLLACASRARGMAEEVRAGCVNPSLLDRAA